MRLDNINHLCDCAPKSICHIIGEIERDTTRGIDVKFSGDGHN